MSIPRLPLLLVEDDPGHAALVQHCLEDYPVKVYHTSDGEAALDYLFHQGLYAEPSENPRPRVILLDLNLPKLNGHDVLRVIKASEPLCAIPVVVFTTSMSEEDVAQAYACHANSYIVKPLDLGAFEEALESICMFWLMWNHTVASDLEATRKKEGDYGVKKSSLNN